MMSLDIRSEGVADKDDKYLQDEIKKIDAEIALIKICLTLKIRSLD